LVGAAVGLHRNRHRPGDSSGGCFSEGWGLLVATGGDFRGHQRGPQMATSGDFLVATDIRFRDPGVEAGPEAPTHDELIKEASSRLEAAIRAWNGSVAQATAEYSKAVKEMVGRADRARKAIEAELKPEKLGRLAGITLFDDRIVANRKGQPVTSDLQAAVDTAGNLSHTRRHTLTRFGLLGPFSVFTPKNVKSDDRELFILLEGSDWAEVIKIGNSKQMAARKFVQQVSIATRSVEEVQRGRWGRAVALQTELIRIAQDWTEVDEAQRQLIEAHSERAAILSAAPGLEQLVPPDLTEKGRTIKKARELLRQAEEIAKATPQIPARPVIDVPDLQQRRLELAAASDHDEISDGENDDVANVVQPQREVERPSTGDALQASVSIFDQIRELAELRDKDLITPEQFEMKRQELLDRL